jgi:hypothetical protein
MPFNFLNKNWTQNLGKIFGHTFDVDNNANFGQYNQKVIDPNGIN